MPEKREIIDLDLFIPEPRIIRITEREDPGGLSGIVRRVLRRFGINPPRRVREIDLSKISTRTTLRIEKYFTEFTEAAEKGSMETVEDRMYDLMLSVCQQFHPDIDREWLQRNTVPAQIMRLFEAILEPLMERAARVEEEARRLGKKMAR